MPYSFKGRIQQVGVEVINENSLWLKCQVCGQTWSPNLRTGGRLPRGYWKCPNGCNEAVMDSNKKEGVPMDVEILEVIDRGGIGSLAKGVVNGKVFTACMVPDEPMDRFSWHIKTDGAFSRVERMAVGKALWTKIETETNRRREMTR